MKSLEEMIDSQFDPENFFKNKEEEE